MGLTESISYPCGHSVCATCSIIESCPQCRTVADRPLSTTYTLRVIVDKLKAVELLGINGVDHVDEPLLKGLLVDNDQAYNAFR